MAKITYEMDTVEDKWMIHEINQSAQYSRALSDIYYSARSALNQEDLSEDFKDFLEFVVEESALVMNDPD